MDDFGLRSERSYTNLDVRENDNVTACQNDTNT